MDESSEQDARSHRLQGLGLVLLVALAVPVVLRLEAWVGPPAPADAVAYEVSASALAAVVETLSLLGLLAYVLFRQGRSLRQLGLTARWSDLPLGLALAALTLLPYAVDDVLTRGAPGAWLTSHATLEGVSLIGLLRLVTFALSSGLILCAYVMTEIMALTRSVALAAGASLALREFSLASFGTATAVSLLIGCLFYWRTRRATPVVLAIVAAGAWVLFHTTVAAT